MNSMRFIALVIGIVLFPCAVIAQSKPMPDKPDMVLLPRELAEGAAQWIAAPNATNAVQLYAALTACIADNPSNGMKVQMGPDHCPTVTKALADRDAEKAAKEKPPEAAK
jgi:hypothetical protein